MHAVPGKKKSLFCPPSHHPRAGQPLTESFSLCPAVTAHVRPRKGARQRLRREGQQRYHRSSVVARWRRRWLAVETPLPYSINTSAVKGLESARACASTHLSIALGTERIKNSYERTHWLHRGRGEAGLSIANRRCWPTRSYHGGRPRWKEQMFCKDKKYIHVELAAYADAKLDMDTEHRVITAKKKKKKTNQYTPHNGANTNAPKKPNLWVQPK